MGVLKWAVSILAAMITLAIVIGGGVFFIAAIAIGGLTIAGVMLIGFVAYCFKNLLDGE